MGITRARIFARFQTNQGVCKQVPPRSLLQPRLPALHFTRCECRARRELDDDHQPVASLNAIAAVGPSDSSPDHYPLPTYLPSKPNCAGPELISCTVASVGPPHHMLGTRHP